MIEIGKYSQSRFLGTFSKYHVPQEYGMPIYDYLINGFHPGGFYSAVLANDFTGALLRSHPGNDIPSLKNLSSWLVNNLHRGITWGSYQTVDHWLKLNDEDRKAHLVEIGLIYKQEDEVMLILKDAPCEEVKLY